LGHHRGYFCEEERRHKNAVESLKEKVVQMNKDRKKQRLAEKKKLRSLKDLKRMPKIWLVSDIFSNTWILEQLDPNKTLMVVDEPPMGSDAVPTNPEDNEVSRCMVEGMLCPMYKTLLMSATMPREHQLPSIVDNFVTRFGCADKKSCINECFSAQLDAGVILVRPSGGIAFPHELCSTAEELKQLCHRLPGDPLTLKAYTERALSQLWVRWRRLVEAKKTPAGWKPPIMPEEKFADLATLRPDAIRTYTVMLLQSVADAGDDTFVKEFCGMAADAEELSQFPEFDIKELLFKNAHAFPGVSLVADDKPREILLEMAEKLIEQFPKASELENEMNAADEEVAKQNKELEKRAGKDADEGEVQMFSNDNQQIKFDSSLVIQTEQFLKRWCPSAKKESLMYPRMPPTFRDFKALHELPVDDVWKMLALSGAGAFDPELDADKSRPIYTQWVHDRMQANKLSCVTAGKEFTWGANLPASTVVVTSSFAQATSVSGMLQYVGRAARRGLTTHGQAIFESNEDLNRIFSKGAQQMSTEADTMERYAKWLLAGKTPESWTAASDATA